MKLKLEFETATFNNSSYKLNNSRNGKLLIKRDFKIVAHAKINHKCCKDVVKTALPLANPCYIRVSKCAAIELLLRIHVL